MLELHQNADNNTKHANEDTSNLKSVTTIKAIDEHKPTIEMVMEAISTTAMSMVKHKC